MQFTCPHCQKTYDINTVTEGKKVKCTRCQKTFIVTPEQPAETALVENIDKIDIGDTAQGVFFQVMGVIYFLLAVFIIYAMGEFGRAPIVFIPILAGGALAGFFLIGIGTIIGKLNDLLKKL